MSEQTALNSVRFQLREIGYHASAIALVDDSTTVYLGWYMGQGFLDEQKRLEHIGALVRGVSDSQPEPREELKFGIPERRIIKAGDIQLRHLSLDEIARFQAGYDNPKVHFDPKHIYDYIDGKPMS